MTLSAAVDKRKSLKINFINQNLCSRVSGGLKWIDGWMDGSSSGSAFVINALTK